VTYPPPQQPGPRPFPPPGGYRPAPPPQAQGVRPQPPTPQPPTSQPATSQPPTPDRSEWADESTATGGDGTGHPAVDAVLRSLANAAQLAPADQIAEYEAAHRVLQETLSSIDG
jgi:hypothetical protein